MKAVLEYHLPNLREKEKKGVKRKKSYEEYAKIREKEALICKQS